MYNKTIAENIIKALELRSISYLGLKKHISIVCILSFVNELSLDSYCLSYQRAPIALSSCISRHLTSTLFYVSMFGEIRELVDMCSLFTYTTYATYSNNLNFGIERYCKYRQHPYCSQTVGSVV